MKKTSTVIWRALRGIKISRYIHKSSPSNVVGDLPRTAVLSSATNTTSVEDSRVLRTATSGMTALFDNGFTLVELLVVVLIIGVLTAVAVPMYQSAVDKSHFSTMLPGARAIKNAEEAYWLANGYYTNDETSLDVSAPAEDVTFTYEVKGEDGGTHNVIRATNSKLSNVRLASYLDDNTQYAGQLHCEASTGDERANKLCGKTLLGTQIKEINTGYMSYLLNQEMDAPTCGDAGMSWSTSKEKCYKTNAERCDALGVPELNSKECGYSLYNGSNLVIGAETVCDAGTTNWCIGVTVKDGGICRGHGYDGCRGAIIENGGICESTNTTSRGCTSVTVNTGGMCIVMDESSSCSEGSNINGGVVVCNGSASYCGHSSVYDGGICVSASENGVRNCWGGKFTNGSICYANTPSSCSYNATYDDTSCCCGGDTNCGSARQCSPAQCADALEKVNTLLENGGYDPIQPN